MTNNVEKVLYKFIIYVYFCNSLLRIYMWSLMNLTFPGWAPSVHHFDEIYAIFQSLPALRGLERESLYKHNVYTNTKNLDL